MEPSSSRKPNATARDAGEPFSPNRVMQRLDHRQYSPAFLTKAVCTATATRSFEEAAKVLEIAASLKISPRHLQTLCSEVGDELVERRKARNRAYRERPLNTPVRVADPPIPLGVVMVDGGRVQTRQPGNGPGVRGQAWRESKTALFLRMTHEPADCDPRPQLPRCFAHPLEEAAGVTDVSGPAGSEHKPRTILFRTGLATLENSEDFAWQAAAAAEERGFFSADAKAYVCDGQAYNWTIHRRHFGSFEPILDFVHASEHIHAAAAAAGRSGEGWAEACWQGRISDVLAEIAERMNQLTPPEEPDKESDHPWCVLRREHVYLTNNQQRMDYPRYRKDGLPITSSPIESWVKQLNQRVKGSEKFWNDDGNAEAILELRSAWLGDDEALVKHLRSRPGQSAARPRTSRPSSRAA
jgi:hypothetical protein